MITLKTTHESEALAKLLQQLKGKVTTEALVGVLAAPVQAVENALFEILAETPVDVAVGEQLDGVGRLVDFPRHGMIDATYRLYLQARLLILRSCGQIETILTILDFVTGGDKTLVLTETPDTDPAYFHVEIQEEILDADPLVDLMIVSAMTALLARAAGVKGVVHIRREGAFRFDSPGFGFGVGARFSTAVGDS